jgi:hypothetical protein
MPGSQGGPEVGAGSGRRHSSKAAVSAAVLVRDRRLQSAAGGGVLTGLRHRGEQLARRSARTARL